MLTLHLQYLFFCKAGKQIVPFACLGCESNRMISIVYSGKKISAEIAQLRIASSIYGSVNFSTLPGLYSPAAKATAHSPDDHHK